MKYSGRYKLFNLNNINTYPIKTRKNKVKVEDLISPEDIKKFAFEIKKETKKDIRLIAVKILEAINSKKPVIIFTGAHLIKNGLSPLIIDMVNKNLVTLVAGTCATTIHDFELALIGQTSEDVPNALKEGKFGTAYEFSYMNEAINTGYSMGLGLGESLGMAIADSGFRDKAFGKLNYPAHFKYPDSSLIFSCYKKSVPFTAHVSIGTDVVDQHPSFDGCAKGGCSARDFLIYANEVSKLTSGGVVLNIGSAVTGPEVFLKAVSMAANTGKVPQNIITGDFDFRPKGLKDFKDDNSPAYYFRDQKSVVTRIPEAFGGKGYYIQGNQKQTVPYFYKNIIDLLRE
jgi:hypothetical protein